MKKALLFLFFLAIGFAFTPNAKAQCSMCTINAEQGTKNGNNQTKGINDGVVYLLSIPYLLIVGVGLIWYKNYRKKATSPTLNTEN
ncbi:hypothetical protein VRU48_13020 [Pedobacter sp. KR3-3]|uniref:Uncharacterized protein n=1 Tax=Pedobacter albus TaxID=3113905 RepID=A0ABU7I993_9SPHI|nr:hypothetical protein [Pedobacter sp. KR3-3]MEE1946036.1 hypothetical protein [Pedobacter sp. KR3-3]